MRFWRKKKQPDDAPNASGAFAILRALADRCGLRISDARLKEAWQAAPSQWPEDRLIEAAVTIGLEPIPTRLTGQSDHELVFVQGRTRSGLLLSLTVDGAETLGLDGAALAPTDWTQPRRVWRFRVADAEDSSGKARLKAVNPLRNLGTTRIGWILIAAALSNVLGLATSLFVMVVYDRVLPNEASESLYALAAGVGLAVIFDTILKSARTGILDAASKDADRKIMEDIFDQFVEARPAGKSRNVGELSSVIRNFEIYREFATTTTILSFVDLPFVALFIFVIAQVSGSLWIVPAVAVPVVLLLVMMVQPLVARATRQATQVAQSRQSLLVEILSGLDHLRVSGAYGILKRRFLIQSSQQTEALAGAKRSSSIVANVVGVMQQVFQVGLIVMGFHLFVTDQITMGGIIAAVILFGRVMGPLSRLGQTLGRTNQALASYRIVRDFLAVERKTETAVPVRLDPDVPAALELSNVTLRLSEGAAPLLNGLSLRVPHGQKVAIVGRTGAGKTSILRLFAGLLRPETGVVLLNGIPVGAYPRADLYRTVGTVFQTPWLFAGTLRDNLTLGQADLDDAAAMQGLKLAGLVNAEGKGMQLDSWIAEQGDNLSGGQRQAVNVARALTPMPDILMMDEPSSAMDSTLESSLVERIKTELKDRTILLVTHKARLLDLCDRVIMLEGGEIKGDMTAQEFRQRQMAVSRGATAGRALAEGEQQQAARPQHTPRRRTTPQVPQ